MFKWCTSTMFLCILFLMNVVQFTIIVVGLGHILKTIWRETEPTQTKPRLVIPIGYNRSQQETCAMFARGLSRKKVRQFKSQLTPANVTRDLIKPKGIGDKTSKDDTKSSEDIMRWGKDPLVYFSAVTSKFAKEYTPLHAKAAWCYSQIAGELVMPHSLSSGTAFVLPTGHVINKSAGMTAEDIIAHNPPKPNSEIDLTAHCADAPVVSRTNLFGYAGSKSNLDSLKNNTTETLLCPCQSHRDRLEIPNSTTFSSSSDVIEVDVPNKKVLLPGAGTALFKSRQPTTFGVLKDHTETSVEVKAKEMHNTEVPVYGAGLVTLPIDGLPLSLNCICTDRKDGTYKVSRPTSREIEGGGGVLEANVFYRHVANYLNSNPTKAAALHSHVGKEGSTWLLDGGPINTVTCTNEQVSNLG